MLEIQNITKLFGAIVALNNVSVTFKKGEIHGLVGKNGAGKSTLVDIIYGRIPPTNGKMRIDGTNIDFRRFIPGAAQKMKIALVPQHPIFAEDLSIEENLFLNFEKLNKFKNLDKQYMKKKTVEILEKISLQNFSQDTKVNEMSVADKQLLNVGQVLYLKNIEILLLDEIAAGLSKERMSLVAEQLRKEREKNKIIIYVSHRLKEVLDLCDRVTVLRDGEFIITEDTQKIDFADLTKYIVGADTNLPTFRDESYLKNYNIEPLVEVKNLSADDNLRKINLKVYKGEVLGITGLVGSGVKQLMEVLGGVRHFHEGEIYYSGKKVFFNDPHDAIRNGIVYLSDDREEESIFGDFSIKDNVIAGSWKQTANALGIKLKRELELFNKIVRQLSLKYGRFSDNINTLSGGNKQKVCVGRLINMMPSIFVLNEPIKGIDVGVKYELMELIRETLTKYSTVIMTTPGIEELLMVADRIAVLYKGEIHEIISKNEFSESRVFKSIQGE